MIEQFETNKSDILDPALLRAMNEELREKIRRSDKLLLTARRRQKMLSTLVMLLDHASVSAKSFI